MSRAQPLMAGNWKMHHTHLEAIQVVQKLSYRLDAKDYKVVDVAVCPAFTALRSVQTTLDSDRIPIALGAQNCHWEPQGAYTGEVSAPMLAKLNVRYVIVGHSERRELFGETDDMVAKKLRAVLANGMQPIVCVGETLEEREQGVTDDKVRGQVEAALAGLPERGRRAVRRRLRADLGDRDGPDRHPRRCERDDRGHPGAAARHLRRGRRRDADPLRGQHEAGERGRPDGDAGHRRGPRGGRLARSRRFRPNHPVRPVTPVIVVFRAPRVRVSLGGESKHGRKEGMFRC